MNKKLGNQKNIDKCFLALLIFISLLLFVILVEGDHILRSSVGDDVALIKTKCTDFWGFINGGYKFRPVSGLLIGIISVFSNGDSYLYGCCNLFIQAGIATAIYYFICKMFNFNKLAYISAITYIVSHLSYYQITTQHGILEASGLFFTICTVYFLYGYINEGENKNFYFSLIMYFLASMCHERYVVLYPIFILVGVYDVYNFKEKKINKKAIIRFIISSATFACAMFLFNIMVDEIMMGTGGQVVKFDLNSWFAHFFEYVGYLFGVNSADTWLSMVGWNQYPEEIRIIIIVSIVIIFALICNLFICFIRAQKDDKIKIFLSTCIFVLSIGALATISSTTIRVELRWVYTSFVILMMLLLYSAKLSKGLKIECLMKSIMVVYFVICIVFSLFVRIHYPNLYYWRDYELANNLYDYTFKEYRYGMYDKKWIIINDENSYDSYAMILDRFDIYEEYNLDLVVVNTLEEAKEYSIYDDVQILYISGTKVSNITGIFENKPELTTNMYEDKNIGKSLLININTKARYLCFDLHILPNMENAYTVYINDSLYEKKEVIAGVYQIKIPLNDTVKQVEFIFDKVYINEPDVRELTAYLPNGVWLEKE